ncbi:MAG: MFS transporter, partial [Dehalococcoidia bacterium]|nr:MFS transporter [Dehalococcoidia bacterium]
TAVIVFGLAMLTVRNVVNEWHVLIAAFLIGAVQALDTPARQSVFPRLIEREALFNAVALNSSVWTGTRIFAPALAGVIVGLADVSMGFFVSAAGVLVLGIVSYTLRLSPVERARGSVFNGMMEGYTFIRGTPIFSILICMTFFNAMFGMSYVFLMPAFAEEVLDVGPGKLGLLIGAAGLGALTGILISAYLSSARHKGWILIGGITFFGIFLILFGILANAGQYGLSMVALFLADMGVSMYLMMVITTLQSRVPDQIRGRVMGFYSITWSLIPLGGLQASQVGHYTSAPIAVIIGGALVVAFAIGIALTSRRVRTLGSSDEAM